MKKICTLFLLMLLVNGAFAKFVPQQDAAKLAASFYRLNNPNAGSNAEISSQTVQTWENVPALYIFRFTSGGFVLVAADDASIPVPGYSFENDMPEQIKSPAAKAWLENYCREIAYIISNKFDNSQTLPEWSSILEGRPLAPSYDVQPLTTTLWDQGCYYNTSCPADGGGACGHAITGCVATCMAQIMKYHNYPPQGVGQHTYNSPNYGPLTVDFGSTTYNWTSMPNSVNTANPAVATIMYHAGVSVDMNYGPGLSGAFSEDVPGALLNYFNYSPDIDIKYKDNYANVEDFKSLLRSDLDQHLPIYYSGSGPGGGHAFVCDGYRLSDGKFHFNWGWSGGANGYYAIGNLNPSGYTFNTGNAVVVHIKPYNANLIVRTLHPADKALIGVGYSVEIKAKVVRGSASMMKIFIDSVEKFSVAADSISFTWNTTSADLGSHIVKAYAYNTTDTVYYKTLLNVAEWVPQASGFTTVPRAINYMYAVDSNVVWATGADGNNLSGACSDFTRTTNGGNTWVPGVITNTTGLSSAMVFAMDSMTAYVPMFKVGGSKPQGIYMTADGGATWARQTTALFSNTISFPNIVHFFNANDGICMGDPIGGKFEIYTTTNAGTNWTAIPAAGSPSPLSGEFGVVGYYSAVQDTIWFGTNKGRVYRSVNKGVTWTVSAVTLMNAAYVKPVFRNGSHGLLLDESTGMGLLCESFDGGLTWAQVNYTGSPYSGDIAYVPRTPNSWVRSSYNGNPGCCYSFDGGHTWTDFIGTAGSQYMQMSWVNNHCGWAGTTNTSPTENGAYKFIGLMQPPLPLPRNVHASPASHSVTLTWQPPLYDTLVMTGVGYNIRRNGIRLNPAPDTDTTYTDQGVPSGHYQYCVSAIYNIGESGDSCTVVDVAVGISDKGQEPELLIYPNPAHGRVTLKTLANPIEVSIFDQLGNRLDAPLKIISAGMMSLDISALRPGLYLLNISGDRGEARTKLVVY